MISGLFADGLEVSRTCNDGKGEHQQKFDRHDEVEGVNQMKEAVGPVRKDMAIIITPPFPSTPRPKRVARRPDAALRMSDRRLLYAAGSLRAVSAATTGVALGAYLKTLGHGAAAVGYVTSAGDLRAERSPCCSRRSAPLPKSIRRRAPLLLSYRETRDGEDRRGPLRLAALFARPRMSHRNGHVRSHTTPLQRMLPVCPSE